MLEEAISYPVRDDDSIVPIVIGGVLVFFWFLVLPLFILAGYFLRVLGSAARGEESAPEFEDWGSMLIDGLKASVVSIVYFIPYFVLLAVPVILAPSGNNPSIVTSVTFFLGLLYVLLVYYILPVSLTNLALKGRLGAAFEFRRIFAAAFTGRYLVAVILSMMASFFFTIIIFILFLVLIGLVLNPFVYFYLYAFTAYLLGTGCGQKLIEGGPSTKETQTELVEH